MLLRRRRCHGRLDWETAHLGDPHEDLGWVTNPLRAYEHSIAGAWEAGDFLQRWSERTGIAVDAERVHWWRVLANVKLTVIVLTGIHSFLDKRSDRVFPNPVALFPLLLDQMGRDAPDDLRAIVGHQRHPHTRRRSASRRRLRARHVVGSRQAALTTLSQTWHAIPEFLLWDSTITATILDLVGSPTPPPPGERFDIPALEKHHRELRERLEQSMPIILDNTAACAATVAHFRERADRFTSLARNDN